MDMKQIEKLTWAPIIPLIGGLSIAAEQMFDKKPEYVLSYTPFQHNDKHYVHYLRKRGWTGNYYVLNEKQDNIIPDAIHIQDHFEVIPAVDVICGCPPCAGLSSLSKFSSSDNAINDYMLNSAEFVLRNMYPKIYLFENAPRLATDVGKPVLEKLLAYARKYGYTLTLYATESRLHGNCQIRPRTFGIFCQKEYFGNNALIPKFIEHRTGTFVEYMENAKLDMILYENSPMNKPINKNKPSDDPYYKFISEKYGIKNHAELIKKICDDFNSDSSLRNVAVGLVDKDYDALSDWFSKHGYDVEAERTLHWKKQSELKRRYWSRHIYASYTVAPAFVHPIQKLLMHPFEDRFLTYREGLCLMGMPGNFELYTKRPKSDFNHMSQNVPVGTARDIYKIVLKWFAERNSDDLIGQLCYNSDAIIVKHKYNDAIVNIGKTTDVMHDLFYDFD